MSQMNNEIYEVLPLKTKAKLMDSFSLYEPPLKSDEKKIKILRVTYRDLGELQKAMMIEEWLGGEDFDGLVR